MFNRVQGLQTNLSVEPNYLDLLRDQRFVLEQIKQRVEGKYYESEGYIILVTNWLGSEYHECDEAMIEEDGSVKFKVFFEAITFQIKKFDIIDCICTSCEQACVHAKLGPVDILISRQDIPTNYSFSEQELCFKDQDHYVVIKPGTRLRTKIFHIRFSNGLKAVGKLTGQGIEELCGPLDDELKL